MTSKETTYDSVDICRESKVIYKLTRSQYIGSKDLQSRRARDSKKLFSHSPCRALPLAFKLPPLPVSLKIWVSSHPDRQKTMMYTK